jgi:hypothetical protein
MSSAAGIRARKTALAALAALLALATAQVDPGGNYPETIALPIRSPHGAVSGEGTTVYVGSHLGEIYLANVKAGNGTLLNPGGDGQTFADLCRDSRGDTTLYGAGRGTGLLFAFDARGSPIRALRVTPASTPVRPHFVSACKQTRYLLIVLDAFENFIYLYDLPDVGPDRGNPPPEAAVPRAVALSGDWIPSPTVGATSVEWSWIWNTTAFVLNSGTGTLYTLDLAATKTTALLKRVNIQGEQKSFPGSWKIAFDVSNELVMYIAHPGRNAIAVIELAKANPNNAKYITTITSPLIDGPVGLAEYGNWLYAVNANFGAKNRLTANYNMVQLPKHVMSVPEDADPAQPFSPTATSPDPPQSEQYSSTSVVQVLTAAQPVLKRTPPPSTSNPKASTPGHGDTTAANASSNGTSPSGGTFAGEGPKVPQEGGGGACFPAGAIVQLHSGALVPMSQLKLGDRVLVSATQKREDAFSGIFLFTHRDAEITSWFVRIHHSKDLGTPFMASPGHYLYVNDVLTSAEAIKVGDMLHVAHMEGSSRVSRVEYVTAKGLFNPQTAHGDIVVNGVLASTFTTTVKPSVAHALLMPIRVIALSFGDSWFRLASFLNIFHHGSPFLAHFAPSGPQIHHP